MKKMPLGANVTVFLLFFGVATLEAFQSANWLKAALWLAIGLIFLVGDNLKKTAQPRPACSALAGRDEAVPSHIEKHV